MFNRYFCRVRFNSGCPSIVQATYVCTPMFNRHFCPRRFDSVCPSITHVTPGLRPNVQPAFLRKRYYSCFPSIVLATPCLRANIQLAFLPRKIWISLLIYCTSNPCCVSKFNRHFCCGRFDWGYPSIAHATPVAFHIQPAFVPRKIGFSWPIYCTSNPMLRVQIQLAFLLRKIRLRLPIYRTSNPMFAPRCSTGISAEEDLIQVAHLSHTQPHVCTPLFNRHFCRGGFESGCPSNAQATTC